MNPNPLANYLKNEYETASRDGILIEILPIKKICDMQIEVVLKIDKYKRAWLKMSSNKIYDSDDSRSLKMYNGPLIYSEYNGEERTEYSLLFFEKVLTALKDKLPLIRFNKLNGDFVYENEIQQEDLWSEYLVSNNIILEHAECCCCYEKTKNFTKCGHSLCYFCYENIKEDEETSDMLCPICRAVI